MFIGMNEVCLCVTVFHLFHLFPPPPSGFAAMQWPMKLSWSWLPVLFLYLVWFFSILSCLKSHASSGIWGGGCLNPKLKRASLFDFLNGVQGPRSQKTLGNAWVGYHSTYSNYVRGVSILIRKSLPFSYNQLVLDPKGPYIFLLCTVYTMPLLLVVVYAPVTAEIFIELSVYFSTSPTLATLIVGDFNLVLDPSLDWLKPLHYESRLFGQCCACFGYVDIWRQKNHS